MSVQCCESQAAPKNDKEKDGQTSEVRLLYQHTHQKSQSYLRGEKKLAGLMLGELLVAQ